MAIADHSKNETNFQQLLPHFFYSRETNARIEKAYEAAKNGWFHGMRLDEYARHWIEIPKNPENDLAWHKWNSQTLSTADWKDQEWKTFISYEEFSSGKDNKGQKIFKKAKKVGVISSELLDEINALRDKSTFVWGCISRNPVDYIFASTEQSFNSCLSLDSEHSDAYYMSLPAMILDPHRALFFVTDKKWKRVEVKDIEFERYKIIQRAWVLSLFREDLHEHTPLKKLWVERTYPSEKYPWVSIIPKVMEDGYHPHMYRSTSFKLGTFEDGQEAMIYLDRARLERVYPGRIYYDREGYGAGHFSPKFHWKGGFEDISDLDDLTENQVECQGCADYIDHGEAYFFDGTPYCEECYHERFAYCEYCGEDCSRDEWVSDGNTSMCSNCYRTKTSECVGCGEECYHERFAYCEYCGEEYETEAAIYKTTCGNFCVHCVHENYILDQTDHEYACSLYEDLPTEERLPASQWLWMHPQWKNLEKLLNIESALGVFHTHRVDIREALPPESFDKPSNLLKHCFSYAHERQEGFTNEKYEFWHVIHQGLLAGGL